MISSPAAARTSAAAVATLGLAAASWVLAIRQMDEKLLPPKAAVDIPLALAIVGFGILIVVAPASVPGITPSM